jgi:hypothetical protein
MKQVNIAYLSTVPLFLEPLFGDSAISIATGFCWEHEEALYLITNYHVLSGLHPETRQALSEHGTTPERLRVHLHEESRLGKWAPLDIPLFDRQQRPLWFEHPNLGHAVDIAALRLEPPETLRAFPLNSYRFDDIPIEVGQDVFVIGFPKGVTGTGRFPIWKRGSIASEPEIPLDGFPRLLIDAATREGMSGSPVVAQFTGVRMKKPGQLQGDDWFGTGRAFLGAYSGRISTSSQLEAQLGFVWNAAVIAEIVSSGRRPV